MSPRKDCRDTIALFNHEEKAKKYLSSESTSESRKNLNLQNGDKTTYKDRTERVVI